MKVRFSVFMLLCVAVTSLGILNGCGQQSEEPTGEAEAHANHGHFHGDEVDPHDVPLTEEQKRQMREQTAKFADAVAKIAQLRAAVEQETNGGLPDNPLEAHQALDKVDLVVQWLPEIARESGVAKEHWETVNTAANELRELFDEVHQSIDNKADPDFPSIQEQMDAKIGELKTIAESSPSSE
jgi:hypothetical protein